MIALLNTSHDLDTAEAELGCAVEELFTPLNGFRSQRPSSHFAIDNGAFARFDTTKFLALLARHEDRRDLCRFVAVPDVVGSARRTLEVFDRWHDRLHAWPLALVAQNGQENLEIPWDLIAAVFIGGDDKFKVSKDAEAIVKAAKALGKWAHVGRVNTPGRFEWAEAIGADSIDGMGLALYSHMREAIHEKLTRPRLFDAESEAIA